MSNIKPFVEVVAALIWNGDKFLICQRPANKERGLLWEFVCESGAKRIAVEIDDEASHNPRLVSKDKFTDDLLKQNMWF